MKISIAHGVIIKQKPTDFIAGAETGIKYEALNETGDWTPYLPSDEGQYIGSFDSMACVTFSALNCLETQLNFMLQKGVIPAGDAAKMREWGFIIDNKFNFSDRFTAKMSGTTKQGNTLQNVWDSIRKDGLVPEKMWPSLAKDWNEYYQEIPQEVKNFAKNILSLMEFKYEWIVLASCNHNDMDLYQKNLKQAPLQVAAPVCGRDWAKVMVPCGTCATQHATMIYKLDTFFRDFDHYFPYRNNLALNYALPYTMKGVVVLKSSQTPETPPPFNHIFSTDINYGSRSQEVLWLQKALNLLGYKIPPTGYYGEITRNAVKDFQRKYKVASWPILLWNNGRLVASATRNKLNELISKL